MPDKDTIPPDHTDLSELRQLLLDLLSEYQAFDKPGNVELLKLHIEAYEDKILALFKQYAQPPVVADEELDSILAKLVDNITIAGYGKEDSPNLLLKGSDKQPFAGYLHHRNKAKAALLQREQRLVAEAEREAVEKAMWRLREKQTEASKFSPDMQVVGVGYIISELAQLRHNTNTGKEE